LKKGWAGSLFLGLSVSLISIIMVVGLLEIGIRIFVPEGLWRFRDVTDDWQLHERLGWTNKPNLDMLVPSDRGALISQQANSDGVFPKSARREKTSSVLRIMLFGDSTIVGRGVYADETVSVRLQELLNKRGIPAEVMNAGVEGYSTDQALLRMKELIPLYKPDITGYCFCENDLTGNMKDEAYYLPKPVFTLSEEKVLVESPPDMRGVKIRRLGRNNIRTWVQYSALYRYLRPYIYILRSRLMGWREQDMMKGQTYELFCDSSSWDAIDFKLFEALLIEMDKYCRADGTRFFFYSHPALNEVWDPYIMRNSELCQAAEDGTFNRYALEGYFKKISEDNSIDFCPLIDYFLKNKDRGPFHLLPRDPHCNAAGYEVTAEALAQYIQENVI